MSKPPWAAKQWFEVWYENPWDGGRVQRVDGYRRGQKSAQALAEDMTRRFKCRAWTVEVNRLGSGAIGRTGKTR